MSWDIINYTFSFCNKSVTVQMTQKQYNLYLARAKRSFFKLAPMQNVLNLIEKASNTKELESIAKKYDISYRTIQNWVNKVNKGQSVSPNNHLKGSRCPKCYGTPKYTTAQYIQKANEIHGGKYDYSLVKYEGNKEKIEIICPEHGNFWQHAGAHLRGSQCPACSNVQKVTREIFINRATKLHEGKYDYSLVDFSSTSDYVDIICPIHGTFSQKVSI